MPDSQHADDETLVPATIWRRLLAMTYDSLVLVCLVFIAWQPVPFLLDDSWPMWLNQSIRRGYLILIIFTFFGWFWTHGGQTVGMRAWKIRVISDGDDNIVEPITWGQAAKRFAAAILSLLPLGLGFLWALFSERNRAWHDTLSNSRLVEVV